MDGATHKYSSLKYNTSQQKSSPWEPNPRIYVCQTGFETVSNQGFLKKMKPGYKTGCKSEI